MAWNAAHVIPLGGRQGGESEPSSELRWCSARRVVAVSQASNVGSLPVSKSMVGSTFGIVVGRQWNILPSGWVGPGGYLFWLREVGWNHELAMRPMDGVRRCGEGGSGRAAESADVAESQSVYVTSSKSISTRYQMPKKKKKHIYLAVGVDVDVCARQVSPGLHFVFLSVSPSEPECELLFRRWASLDGAASY